ncbi:MAG TPA: glycosyltransferase family 4 protein [Bacteroidales bacterium]|nr:glycosyltransferase family 4 protein [Bacteroidales bacterium]HPS15958.1 glycosyltransferase family 4 protein [Bacteroidales bacterium]
MNILLGLNTFDVGGAENFVFRLAKALSESGHKVYLFALYDWNIADAKKRIEKILGKEYSKVKIVTRWKPGRIKNVILWRLNGLFLRFGKKDYRENIINNSQIKRLNTFLKKEKIDIVNTHLFEVDEFFSVNFNIPHVISMHGAYEDYLFVKEGKISGEINNDFLELSKKVLNKSKNVIYVADKNLEIFNQVKLENINTRKIYIGYDTSDEEKYNKRDSGEYFVFGMIARGIESKGWEIAINAFEALQKKHQKIKLILAYTETEFMKELENKYKSISGIEFKGFEPVQKNFFESIHALVFPTWIDCVPNSIIESLFYNIPVISTETGEIPGMIVNDDKEAGTIIKLDENTHKPKVEELFNAMEQYLLNNELYETHKRNTFFVKEKFSMDICMRKYIDFYIKAISKGSGVI